MSKTNAWIILSLFGAMLVWGLIVGIAEFGFVKVAINVGVSVLGMLLFMAGLLAVGLAIFFIKDRMAHFYRQKLRPKPWTKPFIVSQRNEAELYDSLKSRLTMIERNDETRSEIYQDQETGQRWRNQYVEQGFGNWYELRPEPHKTHDQS